MTQLFIDYIEFAAVGDVAAAKSFYEAAFGWRFTDYGETYSAFTGPDGSDDGGGLYPSETPVAPLPLLRSTDLDASLAAVEAAGGTIVEPPYAYPGGRRFLFTDPAGNRLGVYQPGA